MTHGFAHIAMTYDDHPAFTILVVIAIITIRIPSMNGGRGGLKKRDTVSRKVNVHLCSTGVVLTLGFQMRHCSPLDRRYVLSLSTKTSQPEGGRQIRGAGRLRALQQL